MDSSKLEALLRSGSLPSTRSAVHVKVKFDTGPRLQLEWHNCRPELVRMTQLVADLGNVGIMQNQSVMIHSRLDFRVLGTHMLGSGPRMDLGQSSRRGQCHSRTITSDDSSPGRSRARRRPFRQTQPTLRSTPSRQHDVCIEQVSGGDSDPTENRLLCWYLQVPSFPASSVPTLS